MSNYIDEGGCLMALWQDCSVILAALCREAMCASICSNSGQVPLVVWFDGEGIKLTAFLFEKWQASYHMAPQAFN